MSIQSPDPTQLQAQDHLQSLVEESGTKLRQSFEGSARRIEQSYMAQDPANDGVILGIMEDGSAAVPLIEATSTALRRTNQKLIGTSGNMMLSRMMHMVAEMAPDVPRAHIRAAMAGAQKAAEDQNQITTFQSLNSNLKEVTERLAMLLLANPYAGLRVHTRPKAKHLADRFKFEAVSAKKCGYELFQRRFVWHQRDMDRSDIEHYLPDVAKRVDFEDCDPWEIYTITEVYHEGYRHLEGSGETDDGKCPVSYYIIKAQTKDYEEHRGLGNYILTELLESCPLAIDGALEPPPHTDIRPTEVATWSTLLDQLSMTQAQIDRERSFLNSVILYDAAAFKPEHILAIQKMRPSGYTYLAVRPGDPMRGVNATMRPVEASNNLQELLAVHAYLLQLFDDLTGLNAMARGQAVNPRKSATEASSIVAAGSRRARRRMSVMADMYAFAFRAMFDMQREVYGETIELPTDALDRIIEVPDPQVARIAFDVSATDIGHLSKQGDAETVFNVMNLVAQVHAQFQGMIPRAVREMLRRTLLIMGIPDANELIDLPVMGEDPRDRLMKAVLRGGSLKPQEQDNHPAYIAYYGQFLEELGPDANPELQLKVQAAEAEHNAAIRRAQRAQIQPNPAASGVVPGVGPNGVDNNVAGDLAAFEPLGIVPAQGR